MAYKKEVNEDEFRAAFEALSGKVKVKDIYAQLAEKYNVKAVDIKVACDQLGLKAKRYREQTEIVFVKSQPVLDEEVGYIENVTATSN